MGWDCPTGACVDFWKTLLVLLRRWYITVPVFLLAFAAATAMYLSRPVHYASYSPSHYSPSGATQFDGLKRAPYLTNPLLTSARGWTTPLPPSSKPSPCRKRSISSGVSPDSDPIFGVTNGSANPELLINGPLVFITAQGTSPDKTLDLVTHVTQRARQELMDLQQGLKAPPTTPDIDSDARSQGQPGLVLEYVRNPYRPGRQFGDGAHLGAPAHVSWLRHLRYRIGGD